MLAIMSPINKVSVVALAKAITESEKTATIADLAKKLNVSLSSEHRNRGLLMEKIGQDPDKRPLNSAPEYITDIVKGLLEQSHGVSGNEQRASYAPWLKAFISKIKHQHRVTYQELEEVLGISSETLMGFSTATPMDAVSIDPLAKKIALIWNNAPPKNKKTIDDFRYFLDKKHGDI
jgi:hypothetical protein